MGAVTSVGRGGPQARNGRQVFLRRQSLLFLSLPCYRPLPHPSTRPSPPPSAPYYAVRRTTSKASRALGGRGNGSDGGCWTVGARPLPFQGRGQQRMPVTRLTRHSCLMRPLNKRSSCSSKYYSANGWLDDERRFRKAAISPDGVA